MLPQHGGVPNFRLKIPGSALILLFLVLISGLLLTLSLKINSDPGDLAAENYVKLSLIATLMLSFFILLAATGRWWHTHLWRHGNSQKQHRRRTRNNHGRRRR